MSPLIDAMAAVFVTADLKASADWYAEKLGFTYKADWSENPTFLIAQREAASVMLKLGDAPSAPVRRLTPGLDLFDAYFWVRDIEALHKDLLARDAPIIEGPVRRIHGCTEVLVKDPDGRFLCFGFCV